VVGRPAITKRGSSEARAWLHLAAMRLLKDDPLIAAWYRARGGYRADRNPVPGGLGHASAEAAGATFAALAREAHQAVRAAGAAGKAHGPVREHAATQIPAQLVHHEARHGRVLLGAARELRRSFAD
jgi:hypothetical protein